MMYSALPRQKAWWDTRAARQYGLGGLAAKLFIKHIVPLIGDPADNDRDHCRW
jgi:hypothetical protein